jgi:hypothetical protein
MTTLERRALARVPLTKAEVEAIYADYPPLAGLKFVRVIRLLCESHERLRAELAGAEELIFGGGEKDPRP